jgi:D-ribose pyranose/furanose isomerase RbsD
VLIGGRVRKKRRLLDATKAAEFDGGEQVKKSSGEKMKKQTEQMKSTIRVGLSKSEPPRSVFILDTTTPIPRGYDYIGDLIGDGKKLTFKTNLKVCRKELPVNLQRELVDSYLGSQPKSKGVKS